MCREMQRWRGQRRKIAGNNEPWKPLPSLCPCPVLSCPALSCPGVSTCRGGGGRDGAFLGEAPGLGSFTAGMSPSAPGTGGRPGPRAPTRPGAASGHRAGCWAPAGAVSPSLPFPCCRGESRCAAGAPAARREGPRGVRSALHRGLGSG